MIRSTKFVRHLGFTLLNILVVMYGLALSVPWLDFPELWFISILGYSSPWLFLFCVVTVTIMAFRRSRQIFLPLVLVTIGVFTLPSTYPVNFGAPVPPEKENLNNIRLFSWNVMRWAIYDRDTNRARQSRSLMLQKVLSANADILCFNEFFEPKGDALIRFESNVELLACNGYDHHVFIPSSIIHNGTKQSGMAIFSKFPIVKSQYKLFSDSEHSEGWMAADLVIKRRTVRVMVAHLESFKNVVNTFTMARKLPANATFKEMAAVFRKTYKLRSAQSGFLRDRIVESPYPVIVCSNLGDIPFSNSYMKARGNLKDAFAESGFGFGKTFDSPIPNLRFDYVFTTQNFFVKSFQLSERVVSDHYSLTVDLCY